MGAAPLPGAIRTFFRQKSFAAPTRIQAQALLLALQGRDVVGIAQTGSRKTLGFLLPCCELRRASKGEKAAKRGSGAARHRARADARAAQQIERGRRGSRRRSARARCACTAGKRHIQERAIWSAGRKLDAVAARRGASPTSCAMGCSS